MTSKIRMPIMLFEKFKFLSINNERKLINKELEDNSIVPTSIPGPTVDLLAHTLRTPMVRIGLPNPFKTIFRVYY